MNPFLNLSTRSKLLIGFGLPILLLLVVSATAYNGLRTLHDSLSRLYEQDFTDATDILNFRAENNGLRASTLNLLIARPEDRAVWLDDIRDRSSRMDKLTEDLLSRHRADASFTLRIQQLNDIRLQQKRTREDQVLPAIAQGKLAEAQALLTGVQQDRFVQIREMTTALTHELTQRAATTVATSEREVVQETRLILLFGLTSLVLAILLAWWLSRIIATPVSEMAQIAERIATGDLSFNLSEQNRKDEVGVLGQAFSRMLKSLREMNRNLQEGVNVLASSSNEILASTSQVAAGAVETATAVSQTSVTVEEVKQTAQVASQKAKYVSESASRASQVSQSGRKSVDELIEGMASAREQMEAIAERIVNLSEQSQAIGEITSTVNDLAEQANLLAVNAAIEAARVGEQGKGFAVVAQEIRSLAEQSKQATTQIRDILTDIQKATAATALAAEQGTKTVEAGFKRSAEAKDAIRQLADAISEAFQAATQIAASSQQQTVGMDQVALAIENIKQASQQNAASTRQSEAAARSLYELGQKLRQT
ncbi:MAG TPA: methyl-accepting chemotaxis protein, partial [Blastocatellia bacterium]|nr:methyl-accepting chemotaxis protein [Blastocatellia bacterium]